MKLIKFGAALKHRKEDGGSSSLATEYPTENRNINVAEVLIRGRYPKKGWAINRLSTMVVFVLSGTGRIVIKDTSAEKFEDKCVIEILAGEPYAWEPDNAVRLLSASSPAWTSEQHQIIE